MKVIPFLHAGLWLAAFSLAAAQTPTKPSPKPAASSKAAPISQGGGARQGEGKTGTLGAGISGGPLLTREELRACLKQEQTLRTRLADVEAQRGPLDAEKQAIANEQAALREQRTPIDAIKAQAEELNARVRAFDARLGDLSNRVKAFNEANRSGTAADREREALNRERAEFESQSSALDAERARLITQNQEAVAAFNAKAAPLDVRVAEWNQGNARWHEAYKALETERQGWVGACADRRYREDDEIAIRRGQ